MLFSRHLEFLVSEWLSLPLLSVSGHPGSRGLRVSQDLGLGALQLGRSQTNWDTLDTVVLAPHKHRSES